MPCPFSKSCASPLAPCRRPRRAVLLAATSRTATLAPLPPFPFFSCCLSLSCSLSPRYARAGAAIAKLLRARLGPPSPAPPRSIPVAAPSPSPRLCFPAPNRTPSRRPGASPPPAPSSSKALVPLVSDTSAVRSGNLDVELQ
ncbi:hypothetical protein VPH35_013732 [Triticum aestivum]